MGANESAIFLAINLVLSGDYQLYGIVALSLKVSLLATLIATCLGLPLAALLAVARFPGRDVITTILNALLGLPPVVVGLFVYLALSRAGPLGELGLLFTPTAMVIAQTILITPIVAAVALRSLEDFNSEYAEQLRALGLTGFERALTLLWEARFSLATAVLAGFGRAVAEVGAVMIVGGNIANVTRVMTTAIALETSKGDLALALALGVILILLALAVNMVAAAAREFGRKTAGEKPARGEV
jgi:tungstate transport system permease protein